jgi:cytochrome c1
MNVRPCLLSLVIFICLGLLPACVGDNQARSYDIRTGGTAEEGKQVIRKYSCGSCHWIPGIQDARGLVGPPLMMFGRRTFIGGEVPNTPENLVRWIRNPQSIESGTAMPALGLTDQQARDVAAYLYTLR